MVGLLHRASDRWRALLVNVVLQWGRRTVCEQMKRAMRVVTALTGVIHVFVGDRGLGSTRFLLVARALHTHAVVRVKRNFVVFDAPPPLKKKRRGRPAQYGRAYHMTDLPLRRMTKTHVPVVIGGRSYQATVWRGRFLRRGFGWVETLEVRWGRRGRLWLCATDEAMSSEEILAAFDGRKAIETAIQEAKALGLGQYRGRRLAGVRRHPLLICVTHSLLSLLALDVLPLKLPTLAWPWYSKEDTIGQVQRRLLKWKELERFSIAFTRTVSLECGDLSPLLESDDKSSLSKWAKSD